jgi:hypothetical protein
MNQLPAICRTVTFPTSPRTFWLLRSGPSELWYKDAVIVLLQPDALREAKAIVLPLLLEPRRSYELIWMDLAGLQLLERFKVSLPRIFEILQ